MTLILKKTTHTHLQVAARFQYERDLVSLGVEFVKRVDGFSHHLLPVHLPQSVQAEAQRRHVQLRRVEAREAECLPKPRRRPLLHGRLVTLPFSREQDHTHLPRVHAAPRFIRDVLRHHHGDQELTGVGTVTEDDHEVTTFGDGWAGRCAGGAGL